MFKDVSMAPVDPILGLSEIYHSDKRDNKINLSIGIYKDEKDTIPILNCVKKAEALILKNENSKNYLSINGMDSFAKYNQLLLFGKNSSIVNNNRVCTVQTPGGTSALRVAADFLVKNNITKRIWISNPTWPNHIGIFRAAGLEVLYYNYFSSENFSFDDLINGLSLVKAGDAVLFHGCCHNPTGIDPNINEWQRLAELSACKHWLPVFDIAYQGFAHGLEDDVKGMHIFCENHEEIIICNSYSKNFGLYNERVGACNIVANNNEIINRIFSQLKYIIRTSYSNPPAHGALIVTTIFEDTSLNIMWKQELNIMRQRIKSMRQLFITNLKKYITKQRFDFIYQQNGMFSFIGLNKDQVLQLREQSGVYVVDSGRINVAGITYDNVMSLCKAISAIL